MMGVIKDIAAIPNIGLKENHTMSTQNAYHFLERDQHLNFSLDIYQFSLPNTLKKKSKTDSCVCYLVFTNRQILFTNNPAAMAHNFS